MYALSNHRDFYQKPLISIKETDYEYMNNLPEITHWLIALQGFEGKQTTRWTWKVIVYTTNDRHIVDYNHPLYVSDDINCFHKACDYAKELEIKCKNDEFTSYLPQLKIASL